MRTITLLIAVALAAVSFAACGEQTTTNDPPLASATVVPGTATVDKEPVKPQKKAAPAPKVEEQDGDMIRVPNVTGMDHQLAQDTMQAAGLYNLAEEDATGQGRMLIWDRNWTVVKQSPAAGSRVREDKTIVLSSVKDDEYDG